MRTLIIVVVLLTIGFGMLGCGQKDAHELYLERNQRLSHQADSRSLLDDIQHAILMEERPSHLSHFTQE